jgi:hypothetical protein
MKTIPLSRGKQMLVDDSDYEQLAKFKWHAETQHGKWYARASRIIGGMLAHRLILQAQTGEQIDHINGDDLDNRRINLRKCTHAENQRNRGKTKRNKSGFKGVSPYGNKWKAQIQVNHVIIKLGEFDDKISAARAYNEAALREFGAFAWLNKLEER